MGMFQVVSSQSAFQVHGNPFGLDVLLHLLCVVRACLGFPVSCLGMVRKGPWWEIQLKIIERPREEQQTSKLWGTLQKNNGKHKVTKIYYQIGIQFIQISHPRHFVHQQKTACLWQLVYQSSAFFELWNSQSTSDSHPLYLLVYQPIGSTICLRHLWSKCHDGFYIMCQWKEWCINPRISKNMQKGDFGEALNRTIWGKFVSSKKLFTPT